MTHPSHRAAKRAPRFASVWPLLACAPIMLAGLAAYSNSFHGPFTFDDKPSILMNRTIQHLWPIHKVLAGGSRPILNLSLAISYNAGGLNVVYYHAFNVAVHILAALTLFGIMRRTLRIAAFDFAQAKDCSLELRSGQGLQNAERKVRDATSEILNPKWDALALAVAIIWEVHPLQTESVTYIIQRAESLMGLFYLLTLYCVIRGANSANARWWHIAAVASCGLGMGAKEVMATAPLVVLLYDRAFLSGSFKESFRRRWGLYVSMAATWLLILPPLAMALTRERTTAGFKMPGITPSAYAMTQPGVILHYLRLSLWPRPLCLDYSDWPLAKTTAQILPGVIVVGLLAITLWALRKRPAWGFLGAWFFVILAPSSSIMPIRDVAFEHRMYLPLAAVIALAVTGAYLLGGGLTRRLATSEKGRRTLGWGLSAAAILGAAGTLGCATFFRNADYRSEIAIWEDAIRKRPDNARAYLNYASSLYLIGQSDKAIEYCAKAIERKSRFPEAYYALGLAYQQKGQWEQAISSYTKAITLKPDYPQAYYCRAAAYHQEARYRQAVNDFTRALELDPSYTDVYGNRGVAYELQGLWDEALRDYDMALKLDPHNAQMFLHRSNVLLGKGQYDRGIKDCDRAIELNPAYANAYNDRGNLFARKGEHGQAIQDYDRAIARKPDYADAYCNRGNSYARMGQTDRAIRDYEKAIALQPGYGEAYYNLGLAHAQSGRCEEAIQEFGRAISLQPDLAEAYNNRGFLHAQAGRHDQAMRDYDKAIQLRPDYVLAYSNRAMAYYQKKEYAKAWSDVKTARKLGGVPAPELVKALTEESGRSE